MYSIIGLEIKFANISKITTPLYVCMKYDEPQNEHLYKMTGG